MSSTYRNVTRYPSAEAALAAYGRVRDILALGRGGIAGRELSVYRCTYGPDAFVVLLGDPPGPELTETLAAVLGEPGDLPETVLRALEARRADVRRTGAVFVERSHRPGRRIT